MEFSEDAARELVDALGSAGGAEMMLVASEVEKLLLYVGGVGKATRGGGGCGDDGVGCQAAEFV